jgi:hypothetical protein
VIFWHKPEARFLTGYANVLEVLEAFVVRHARPLPGENAVSTSLLGFPLYWWEFDIYLGFTGFALLLFFGLYWRWRNEPGAAALRYPGLDGPMVALSWLSVNYFFMPIADLPIPLFSAERVASRFLIVPVVFLLVLAAIQMQRFLSTKRVPAAVYVVLIGGLFQTACVLAEHNWVWKIPEVGPKPPPPIPTLVDTSPDQRYVASVYFSAVVSLLGAVAWTAALLRLRKTQTPLLSPLPPAPSPEREGEPERARVCYHYRAIMCYPFRLPLPAPGRGLGGGVNFVADIA